MSKIVVIASQGQLGSLLLRHLRARGEEAVGVDRDICDLSCPASIQRLFQRFPAVEVIFNAGAFTAVDLAEERRREAFRVNALGPAYLASRCRARGVKLVHFSTDYVFGEGHREPIAEEVEPMPLSVYGRSKLLGEQLAMQYHPEVVILRTCGLYSAHRPNFVRTLVKAALEGRELNVVDDQRVAPTSADALAQLAIEIARTEESGLFHATASGECSWYEFAGVIFKELGMEVSLKPVDSTQWKASARRPEYSVLDNSLLREAGLDTLRKWDVELREFLSRHGKEIVEELMPRRECENRAAE